MLNSSLYQQHISISSLQNELRALCVSSPPSLHSSPVHVSSVMSVTAGATATHTSSHGKSVKSSSSATTAVTAAATVTLPPTSPPSPILPLISEENTLSSTNAKSEEDLAAFVCQQQQQEQYHHQPLPPNNKQNKPLFGGASDFLAKGFAIGAGVGTPLVTPPHSFRSSPVTSPNAMAPFIAITDELGAMQFPILAPPTDFQLVSSHPNLNNDADKSPEQLFNKLHRWNNDESKLI